MVSFHDQLQIQKGVTAIIGGGGKTSLIYRLAEELSAKGSVLVTTSTHIFPPPHIPFSAVAVPFQGILAVGTPVENGKLTAPKQAFNELAAIADYVLVEADGSKHLPIKAHDSHEPVIPENANQVIAVVGALGLNRPIETSVHRASQFLERTGEAVASPRAVADLLSKEELHHRVVINQAESEPSFTLAKELAALLSCPVLIASLQKGEILCSY